MNSRTSFLTAAPSVAGLGNGEERHAGVEVEVAVHAAEESLLRAPAAAGAEHDEVVLPTLDLLEDLRARVPGGLRAVRDHVVGNRCGGLVEDALRPGVELLAHRLAADAGERDVVRGRRRDRG